MGFLQSWPRRRAAAQAVAAPRKQASPGMTPPAEHSGLALPHRRRRQIVPQPGEFSVAAPVTPARIAQGPVRYRAGHSHPQRHRKEKGAQRLHVRGHGNDGGSRMAGERNRHPVMHRRTGRIPIADCRTYRREWRGIRAGDLSRSVAGGAVGEITGMSAGMGRQGGLALVCVWCLRRAACRCGQTQGQVGPCSVRATEQPFGLRNEQPLLKPPPARGTYNWRRTGRPAACSPRKR